MIRPARKGLQAAFVLLSAIGCLTAMPAAAGPLLDAATKAEEKAKSGDQIGAYDIMRTALGDFAATLPLTIGKGVFVADVPTAYGIYTPRADSTFKPGEKLITYVEPIGLTWKPADGGKMQTNFTVDFELMDAKGEVLAGQKTFGNFSFVGYVRNQEIFTHLTLDISGAAPGDYVLRYTLNDTGSNRNVKIDQPFKIAQK